MADVIEINGTKKEILNILTEAIKSKKDLGFITNKEEVIAIAKSEWVANNDMYRYIIESIGPVDAWLALFCNDSLNYEKKFVDYYGPTKKQKDSEKPIEGQMSLFGEEDVNHNTFTFYGNKAIDEMFLKETSYEKKFNPILVEEELCELCASEKTGNKIKKLQFALAYGEYSSKAKAIFAGRKDLDRGAYYIMAQSFDFKVLRKLLINPACPIDILAKFANKPYLRAYGRFDTPMMNHLCTLAQEFISPRRRGLEYDAYRKSTKVSKGDIQSFYYEEPFILSSSNHAFDHREKVQAFLNESKALGLSYLSFGNKLKYNPEDQIMNEDPYLIITGIVPGKDDNFKLIVDSYTDETYSEVKESGITRSLEDLVDYAPVFGYDSSRYDSKKVDQEKEEEDAEEHHLAPDEVFDLTDEELQEVIRELNDKGSPRDK